MPDEPHLPLSLVGELLVKPALKSLGLDEEVRNATSAALPRREAIQGTVIIPIMADSEVLERVLKKLRQL